MLEFIGRKYPSAWLLVASLHEEFEVDGALDRAKEAIRRYLESVPRDTSQRGSWERLARICQQTQDWSGEIHAMVEMCRLPKMAFEIISNTANRLNYLFSQHLRTLVTDEKQVIVGKLVEIMESRIKEADATDCGGLHGSVYISTIKLGREGLPS